MTEYYIYSNNFSIQERQTKKGKVFDVVFRVITLDGEEKQKKLSGFKTKSLAKQAHAQFVTEKCEVTRVRPRKEEKSLKNEITVAELVPEYLQYLFLHDKNKSSVLYEKQKYYQKHILPYLGTLPLSKVTKEDLEKWQDTLLGLTNPTTGQQYSGRYLQKLRACLNGLLSFGENRYKYKNYLPETEKFVFRKKKQVMKFWDKETFDKFISVVDDPTYHCFFTLLFYTGRRKGEVLALTPKDIRADSIVWEKSLTRKVYGSDATHTISTTKEDKVQQLPFCRTVKEELQKYKGDAPFFFGGDRPLAENTVTRTFQRYCNKAGVEIIRIHDLRHSFASMLLRNGENYKVIADLLGDTVEQVIKTYAHISDKDLLSALSKI